MTFQFNRPWLPLLFPAGLLSAVVIVFLAGDPGIVLLRYPSFRYAPYAAFLTAFTLGTVFGYSRISLIAALLASFCFMADRGFRFPAGPGPTALAVSVVGALYIPPFAAILHSLRDHALFSAHGAMRIALVMSAIAATALLSSVPGFDATVSGAGSPLLKPVSAHVTVQWLSLISFAAGITYLSIVRVRRDSPILGAMIAMSLLFALVALNFESTLWGRDAGRPVFLAFMTGSAVTLVVAVLQSSWRHANIDELTDLPGRRPLWNHLAATGRSAVVAVADIDHFKKINDRYGHDTGDQALRFVAAELSRIHGGKAYRYGGEEFVVIMPATAMADAVPVLEDLRRTIASKRFGLRSGNRPRGTNDRARSRRSGSGPAKAIRVTVSIGAADCLQYDSPRDAVDAADAALYRAKRAGRNKLRTAQ